MSYRTLAYEAIAEALRIAVSTKMLPEGTVLLESPIAALFDSSRTPVKQALSMLEEEGLVRRFEGRGVLAGRQGEPLRIKVTADMLKLGIEATEYPKTYAWESFYYDFENRIILRAVFGGVRINELALARHYGVGRTVAGDILNHAAENGIVVRDEKSRWWINPLDEARFQDLYEVRLLLEPAALKTAIQRIPADVLDAMQDRLARTAKKFPNVDSSELDELEEDLHIRVLSYTSNAEFTEALKRTRCILVAGKHIQRAVRGSSAIDAFMDEHMDIMDAIAMRDFETAKRRLSKHLLASSRKAKERLNAFLTISDMTPVPYVIE